MGLFKDKKDSKDEEQQEVSPPTPPPILRAAAAAAAKKAAAAAAASAPVEEAPRHHYGIADAITLMRSLPPDLQHTDIVVQVIKRTLESAKINVTAIIADATRKEDAIENRIKLLQEEISMHEREIATRSTEIQRLQVDLEETSRVKERLVMAEKLQTNNDSEG
jgi:hypothetical protein